MDKIIYKRESINSSNYDSPSERSANYFGSKLLNIMTQKKINPIYNIG